MMYRNRLSNPIAVIAMLAMGCFASTAAAEEDKCFVDPAATGANTGQSWTDAWTDIRGAMVWNAPCDVAYVAGGIYKPSTSGDRNESFVMLTSTTLAGGYASGVPMPAYDPLLYPTIFSGDIDHNDFVDSRGVTLDADDIVGANSYHVFRVGNGVYDTYNVEFHDLIITGGNANGATFPDSAGGGVYCASGSAATNSSCTSFFNNVVLTGNYAEYGGAIYAASPGGFAQTSLYASSLIGNEASMSGGAIYVDASDGGGGSPEIGNTTFYGNRASFGGAIYVDGDNAARPSLFVDRSTFASNHASIMGGTIYLDGRNSELGLLMTDSIIGATSAPSYAAVYASGSDDLTMIKSSVLSQACPTGVTCTDTMIGDPLLGPLAYNGGTTPNMLPGVGSPALEHVPCVQPQFYHWYDQRGVERPQGLACDAGSVEAIAQIVKGWMTDYEEYAPRGNLSIFRVKIMNGNFLLPATGITVAFDGRGFFDSATVAWECRGFRGAVCAQTGSGIMSVSGLSIPVGGFIEFRISTWLLPGVEGYPHGDHKDVVAYVHVTDAYGTRDYRSISKLALFRADFEVRTIEDFPDG